MFGGSLQSAADFDFGGLIFTSFGTILFLDKEAGRLRHDRFEFSPHNVFGVQRGENLQLVSQSGGLRCGIELSPDGRLAKASPVAESVQNDTAKFAVRRLGRGEFGLSVEGLFLSAQPGGELTVDRPVCSDWEAFHLADEFDECTGTVVTQRIDGELIKFFIDNRQDWVQRHQCRGNFYERDELDIVRQYVRPEKVVLDIGANIGNHSIYFSRICGVSRTIAFEPNPSAIRLLDTNLALNRCANVDTRYLGFALGSSRGTCVVEDVAVNNLGGAKIVPNSEGQIPILVGDDILLNEPVGFAKIDVEGMEFEVLAGLKQTIARWRPNLFVEVWRDARDKLGDWLQESGYEVAWNSWDNFILLPAERRKDSIALARG